MADRANCVVCGAEPTVKSHILPRALMHDQRAEAKELYGIRAGHKGYVGLQSGYWQRFLCDRHEAATGEADRYAVDFCRTFYERAEPVHKDLAWAVMGVDADLLHRFICGCIWKTVSTGAARRSLGPYDARMRAILFEDGAERFPMILQRVNMYSSGGTETHVTVLPHHMKLEQANCWSFAVAGIRWTIKTDGRPFGPTLTDLAKHREPLYVLNREPEHISAHPDMRYFARTLGPRKKSIW